MPRILVLFAHPAPRKSRVNSRLIASLEGLDGVTVHDLYDAYPDFAIDVRHEQRLLLEHDVFVFQHPFFWYSTPAILKEWQDLVLEHGWAYGESGDALREKTVLHSITAGGPEDAYQPTGFNGHTIQELVAPFRQTWRLCGVRYIGPFVVHGTLALDEPAILATTQLYRDLIEGIRDGRWDLSADAGTFTPASLRALL